MMSSAPYCLLGIAMVLALVAGDPSPTGLAGPAQPRRIVAIGDIHGAYDSVVELLQGIGLVDAGLHWSGGDTLLIQTGDLTDRGAGVRPVLDLMMRLQNEAPASGGEVAVLLGNHEAMNLIAELRDVTPAIMERFAGDDPASELSDAFEELQQTTLRYDQGWRHATAGQRRQVRQRWVADHAHGYPSYVRAFGPEGVYGSWLRSLPAARVIDGILFMHAGVAPELAAAGWDAERVNARVAAEIATFDRYRDDLRQRRRIPSFANLQEIVSAAARETGGLEWLQDRPARPIAPPALPPADLGSVKSARERYDALFRVADWYLLEAQGPMWFRGLARWSDEQLATDLPPLLDRLRVRAIVVGHTPQLEGIRVRAEGRLFIIDTGMLAEVYGGRAAALELFNGEASILHPDGHREAAGSLPVAAETMRPGS